MELFSAIETKSSGSGRTLFLVNLFTSLNQAKTIQPLDSTTRLTSNYLVTDNRSSRRVIAVSLSFIFVCLACLVSLIWTYWSIQGGEQSGESRHSRYLEHIIVAGKAGNIMPGPSWLSGWVKMNHKHNVVVHHSRTSASGKRENKKACEATATTTTSPSTTATKHIWGAFGLRNSSASSRTPANDTTSHSNHAIQEEAQREEAEAISRQVLREAAFMAEEEQEEARVDDSNHKNVSPESSPPESECAHCESPEGLIVHTTAANEEDPLLQRYRLMPETTSCQRCSDMERTLEAMRDDVEYMRLLAMKQHADGCTCAKCHPRHHRAYPLDLAETHKRQVQALLKEKVRLLLVVRCVCWVAYQCLFFLISNYIFRFPSIDSIRKKPCIAHGWRCKNWRRYVMTSTKKSINEPWKRINCNNKWKW